MRKQYLTIRIMMLLRLISLIMGYNLILSESEINLPGLAALSAGQLIIQAIHHPDPILYEDENKKIYEHILETGPSTYFIKKTLPQFWQKIFLQNQKPATAIFFPERVFDYRRG